MLTNVLVTGGFDPLHSGHISYFNAARELGNRLIVGVNSDAWLQRKKGRSFMDIQERMTLVSNLKMVDQCMTFDDSDGSACDAIRQVLSMYPQDRLIFANGGDRHSNNIPESAVADARLEFAFGVGGENKMNSSSWILQEWKAPRTARSWGHYRVLHETPGVKVKELAVDPGSALSMQRHSDRSEFWLVSSGQATVYQLDRKSTDAECLGTFDQHQYLHIPAGEWHQLANETAEPLTIVEIQYGARCEEQDIERKPI
jgi:cytidyltransferase-like protein